jgi:hypothetical protein
MISRRHRQYIGLAVVIITYVGGIIGWSWAVYTLDQTPDAPADTTAAPEDVRGDAPHAHGISIAVR